MSGIVQRLIEAARRLIGAAEPPFQGEAYGYADLRAGGSRVAIVPELGARISALELAGRQWLATSPVLGMQHATPGADEEFGFGECFPTSAPCVIPTWVQRFGGTALPERGELWSQRPVFEIRTGRHPTAVTTWTGERMPYEFRRTIQVMGDDVVTFDYVAVNRGREPMPFIWSPRPVLPLTSNTRVVLPDGIPARVGAQVGIELGGGAREQRWPRFRLGDRLVDMARPAGVASRYGCKLFFEMPREPVAIEEDGVRLEISADPRDVPHLGLWIDRGASATARGQRAHVLALQPCLGLPDSLSDALGDWKGVQWLPPEGRREWRLTFRARRLTSETQAARESPAESRQPSR